MIDTKELRRLAQAAMAAPDGLSVEWMDRLGQFQEAADASVVSELLDRLEAEENERDDVAQQLVQSEQGKRKISEECDTYKAAYNEWTAKTEWVQQGVNEGTISAKYLGLHRADVMARLLGEAEKERDALRAENAGLVYDMNLLRDNNTALRARSEALERQEPVATVRINVINGNPSVDFVPGHRYLHHNDKLYLAPGAQPAPILPEGWKAVPVEIVDLYSFMCSAFTPMTPQQDQIAIQLDLAKRAMLTSSLGLVDQAMTDHAHELRRYARKIANPAGDVPAVMLAAADEIERLQSIIAGQYTMSRDDIIKLALQCGVWIPIASGPEREQTIDRLQRLVGREVAAEREACAQVCDEMSGSDYLPHQCAAAIRARGNT